ncbi:formylglycine-generating enzyme family protein [Telmatospirillum siberiense]|uniref:Formylglycine-generating enzyme family protein n=1 Tax=Telmatospirillum siberiense TaxID=382514 RepID=A0A2N3PLU1_9PROT|nr:formylglycine-generating enzyme family protein [Telmatospirillum siberiense]PKU21366.1 formylglycine-generating enzyme family protein [Telmatospirillum siberiense]
MNSNKAIFPAGREKTSVGSWNAFCAAMAAMVVSVVLPRREGGRPFNILAVLSAKIIRAFCRPPRNGFVSSLVAGLLFICVIFNTLPAAAQSNAEVSPATEATPSAFTTFRDCPNCPEMVTLPGGTFEMGLSDEDAGRLAVPLNFLVSLRPKHRVSVKAFAIGKYTVTRDEFASFARETGFVSHGCEVYDGRTWINSGSNNWLDPGFDQTGRHPVVCVSWNDAQAFLSWLNTKIGQVAGKRNGGRYRLPTEAEWEYAVRAGTVTSRYWGDDPSAQCVNVNGADQAEKLAFPDKTTVAPCDDGFVRTAPVGTFRPNPWGLFDMLGNVEQWVDDCGHHDYSGAPSDGSAWAAEDCREHVARGGAWVTPPQLITSYDRISFPPDKRSGAFGFRVVKIE